MHLFEDFYFILICLKSRKYIYIAVYIHVVPPSSPGFVSNTQQSLHGQNGVRNCEQSKKLHSCFDHAIGHQTLFIRRQNDIMAN